MPLGYPVELRALDNGLRVAISPDHAVPAVSVNLWVEVGSRHERPGQTGLAHLFEHLMFEGSEHVAEGEYQQTLMDHGGRANATTWFDRTNYFATVPSGALELALWLEADRHGRLLPALTQASLDTQRDVVKEEKRQRYDNQPYGSALADLMAASFPAGHPYHHVPIGSMEDLDAATLEVVHEFYRQHYGPATSVLTLVGDVEVEHGFELAQRYFGELTGPERPVRAAPPREAMAPLPGLQRTTRHDPVPNDRLYLGFRMPRAGDPDLTSGAIALDALGGLTISRLHRVLVRELDLATGVSASCIGLVEGASLGFVGVDVCAGEDLTQVEEVVCAELARFGDEGPTDIEIEASRADTERSWLETLASPADRADLISRSIAVHGDPQYINSYVDRVRSVSPAQVRQAAQQWLQPEHRIVVEHRTPASTASMTSTPSRASTQSRTPAGSSPAGGTDHQIEARQ